MSQRAKELSERFSAFNGQVITFVEGCSEEVWNRVCSGEQWKVGIVARHIAAGHYGALRLARIIVEGDKLPGLTWTQSTRQMRNMLVKMLIAPKPKYWICCATTDHGLLTMLPGCVTQI